MAEHSDCKKHKHEGDHGHKDAHEPCAPKPACEKECTKTCEKGGAPSLIPRLSYHILYVKDMKAAVKFFTEVVGWKVSFGVIVC